MRTFNLKQLSLTFVMSILVSAVAFGQSYEKGDKLLNIGVGIGSGLAPGGANATPPIGLSFEYGTTENISIGGYASYSGAKMATAVGDYKWSFIVVGVRSAYHFDFGPEKLDPYAGAFLGYNIASVKSPGTIPFGGAAAGGFTWSGYAGARYYFTEKIGAFAEVGYGIAILTAGLAVKL